MTNQESLENVERARMTVPEVLKARRSTYDQPREPQSPENRGARGVAWTYRTGRRRTMETLGSKGRAENCSCKFRRIYKEKDIRILV